MTTHNHSALAAIIALPTENASWPIKAIVLFLLALSHLPADMLPHYHFYDIKKVKENLGGAILEVVGGLITLPLVVLLVTGANFWWLAACVFCSNLFDFLVFLGIKPIKSLNHRAHKWQHEGKMENSKIVKWEIGQTVLLFLFVTITIIWYNGLI